jgi:nicotinamide-nucleotide amidase
MFSAPLIDLAAAVIHRCQAAQFRLTTAESCTGGLIAACLTEVPGASAVIERAFVTYGNDAKHDLLGVPRDVLEACGAVSEEVVRLMAEGAATRADAEVAAAVSGIAGPGGGTAAKPVGLVHLAAARRGQATRHRRHVFPGDRTAVRLASVEAALRLLLACLDEDGADQGVPEREL